MKPAELAKYLVYRTPVLNRMMSPSYPYKINPGQLCAMVELIEGSRAAGGAVAEIGVAQGETSVFLLEHLRTRGDPRPLLLFDTFSGFTQESVRVELQDRGKTADRESYDSFRYGDEAILCKRLQRAGFGNFKTHAGDAARFDWSSIGPIGAVLLDIDLYQPTRVCLERIWDHLVPGGGVVLDDCLENTPWDGSLQAYREFIAHHDLPFVRVGEKGALIRKTG